MYHDAKCIWHGVAFFMFLGHFLLVFVSFYCSECYVVTMILIMEFLRSNQSCSLLTVLEEGAVIVRRILGY
jgi:hypothetical protein